MKMRKGDKVIVTAGKDRGQSGTVLRVMPRENLVVVEGVHVAKRHQRRTAKTRRGQIIERPMPIHASNVMLVDPKNGKPTRVKIVRNTEGARTRIAVKSGQEIK